MDLRTKPAQQGIGFLYEISSYDILMGMARSVTSQRMGLLLRMTPQPYKVNYAYCTWRLLFENGW